MAEGAADRRALWRPSHAAALERGRQRRPRTGIGLTGAWVCVRACFGGRALQTRREGGGGAGCTPTPYHSGARARAQGMTKAGHRHGRGLATEWAWRWGREQPERARSGWCRARFGGGGKRLRRLGMVAVARKGLMARWWVVDTGEFPAGAALKEASASFQRGGAPWSRGWWRRPVNLPGLAKQPSERWGRLRQDCPRSSQDAESIGGRVFAPARREGRWRRWAPTPEAAARPIKTRGQSAQRARRKKPVTRA
jgi:Transposase IS116/IS110/IS902 family